MPTLTFFGLCAVGKFPKKKGDSTAGLPYQASMPAVEHHQASILVEASKCDLLGLSKNPPAGFTVVHDNTGKQWLAWNLPPSTDIKFSDTGSFAPASWDAKERARALDLDRYYHGKVTIGPSHTHGVVVTFLGGVFRSGNQVDNYKLVQGTKTLADSLPVPSSFVWQGDAKSLSVGRTPVLLQPDAAVVFTNVSTAMGAMGGGLGHFRLYYSEFFKPPLAVDQQVLIQHPGITALHIDVYDCVPPVAMPE